MIRSNLYVKISLVVLVILVAFLFFYNSKTDVEKCADDKLRNNFQGHSANEEWLNQNLKEKFKFAKYETIFELCELLKKKTPETFKNKYR